MNARTTVFIYAAASLLAVTQVWAHHGAGVFDPDTTISVTGTVTDFQFVNPHVLVYITVTMEDGTEAQWAGELTSPNRLARRGGDVQWHKNILTPGDEIEMTGHPARNGAPAIDITRIIDAAGVALIGGNG